VHDHRCLARGKPGGHALGPVFRGTRRRPAVRPAPADTESLTQHGPAAGWVQRGRIARGAICAAPCWLASGTEGRTPSRYTSGPGVGQQHLRHARTPRIGGEGWKRRRSMPSSPASTRKAERLTTTLVTYGCIFVEAEIILVCHAEGLNAGLGIVHRDASGPAPYRRNSQHPHELTEDRDNPLTARAVRRPGCRPQRRALKRLMTRADTDEGCDIWCTTPGRLARETGGQCTPSSWSNRPGDARRWSPVDDEQAVHRVPS
jgi:hypothetical protein